MCSFAEMETYPRLREHTRNIEVTIDNEVIGSGPMIPPDVLERLLEAIASNKLSCSYLAASNFTLYATYAIIPTESLLSTIDDMIASQMTMDAALCLWRYAYTYWQTTLKINVAAAQFFKKHNITFPFQTKDLQYPELRRFSHSDTCSCCYCITSRNNGTIQFNAPLRYGMGTEARMCVELMNELKYLLKEAYYGNKRNSGEIRVMPSRKRQRVTSPTLVPEESSYSISPESVPLKLMIPRDAAYAEALAEAWVKKYLQLSPGDSLLSKRLIKLCGVVIPRHFHFIVEAIRSVFGYAVGIIRINKKRVYTNLKVLNRGGAVIILVQIADHVEVSSESESSVEDNTEDVVEKEEIEEVKEEEEADPKPVDGQYSVETAVAWVKKNVCIARNHFLTSRTVMNRFGIKNKNMLNMHRAMTRVFGYKVPVARYNRDRGWMHAMLIGDEESQSTEMKPTPSYQDLQIEAIVPWIRKYIRMSKGSFLPSGTIANVAGLSLKHGMQCFHAAMAIVFEDRVKVGRVDLKRGWEDIQLVPGKIEPVAMPEPPQARSRSSKPALPPSSSMNEIALTPRQPDPTQVHSGQPSLSQPNIALDDESATVPQPQSSQEFSAPPSPASVSSNDNEDAATKWARKHIRFARGEFLFKEKVSAACKIAGKDKMRRIEAAVKYIYDGKIHEGSLNNMRGWVNARMVNMR